METIGILTISENLKLARARDPISSSSQIRFNQGEWVSQLVHSKHKLDSIEDSRAQGQQKIDITYAIFLKILRNLSESDSENVAANFPDLLSSNH